MNILLAKYDDGFVSLDEFLEGLKYFAKETLALKDEASKMGFKHEEMAFFEILMEDKYTQNHKEHAIVKKIVIEIFGKIYKTLDKTWFYNEGQKQMVKADLFSILIENGYPRENSVGLREQLILQLNEQIERNPSMILKEKEDDDE